MMMILGVINRHCGKNKVLVLN